VLGAIEQLKQIRLDYISTERIQFICEQAEIVISTDENDDITKQAESNLQAYQDLFYTTEKGVM